MTTSDKPYSVDQNAHRFARELQLLFQQYPRHSWQDHPGFERAAYHWLGAHKMFGNMAEELRKRTRAYMDKEMDARLLGRGLSYYGRHLVNNLHAHHNFEDHAFFPRVDQADSRFKRGLDILEADHVELSGHLDALVGDANSVLASVEAEGPELFAKAGKLLNTLDEITDFLDRHLADEEDLIVPILLHHGLNLH